jgi:hypothetical protein
MVLGHGGSPGTTVPDLEVMIAALVFRRREQREHHWLSDG